MKSCLMSAFLILIATFAAGAAEASERPGSARVSTDESRLGFQRPGMQPRDGDYSWCEEEGGALVCGEVTCWEKLGMSYCVRYITNRTPLEE